MNSQICHAKCGVVFLLLFFVMGCGSQQPQSATPALTATAVRAARRAFDGSPPVVPHKPLGAACITCHTETGKPIPDMAFAPANPHGNASNFENCRQCHLFQQSEDLFVSNTFEGLPVSIRHGDRLFATSPPTIPHSLLMRDNCLACHSGPSARPEIRCSHPDRQNCKQCHVEAAKPVDPIPEFGQLLLQ